MQTTPHPLSLTAADIRAWTDPEERADRMYESTYSRALDSALGSIRERISAILRSGAGSIELLDEVGVRHTFNAEDLFDAIAGHHAPEAWGIWLGVAVLDGEHARQAFRNADIFRRDFEAFIQRRAHYAAQQEATLALIEEPQL